MSEILCFIPKGKHKTLRTIWIDVMWHIVGAGFNVVILGLLKRIIHLFVSMQWAFQNPNEKLSILYLTKLTNKLHNRRWALIAFLGVSHVAPEEVLQQWTMGEGLLPGIANKREGPEGQN